MRKKLKQKLCGITIIVDDRFPNPISVKVAEIAEERAKEVDVKILRELAKGMIKRLGIDYCPCCLADLPPFSPLKKNVHTKTLPKRGSK